MATVPVPVLFPPLTNQPVKYPALPCPPPLPRSLWGWMWLLVSSCTGVKDSTLQPCKAATDATSLPVPAPVLAPCTAAPPCTLPPIPPGQTHIQHTAHTTPRGVLRTCGHVATKQPASSLSGGGHEPIIGTKPWWLHPLRQVLRQLPQPATPARYTGRLNRHVPTYMTTYTCAIYIHIYHDTHEPLFIINTYCTLFILIRMPLVRYFYLYINL